MLLGASSHCVACHPLGYGLGYYSQFILFIYLLCSVAFKLVIGLADPKLCTSNAGFAVDPCMRGTYAAHETGLSQVHVLVVMSNLASGSKKITKYNKIMGKLSKNS